MWLTAVKDTNYYSWSMESNTGRSARSASILAMSVPSAYTATTSFTQSGEDPFISISSPNPRGLDAQGGSFVIACNTNLASVDVAVSGSVGKNSLTLTYVGATGQSGVNISASSLNGTFTGSRLTFINDPGASSSFQFFVTYSFGTNTTSNLLLGEVYFVTGSELQAIQSVTQSRGYID
jgi:hypothetical protein